MNIQDSVVLVTGAERALGREFVMALMGRGARKVYAASHISRDINMPGVEGVQLDVSQSGQIAAAAARCSDVNLLINSAGIPAGCIWPDASNLERESKFSGTLAMCHAFAPLLEANGGGAIVNVISMQRWGTASGGIAYGASKAAAWSLTNDLRHELEEQGTEVAALHVGFMDADITRSIEAAEFEPADVALETLIVLEAGGDEGPARAERGSALLG